MTRREHHETPERQAILHLLDARGIDRCELFLTQREGQRLPGGLEAVSGFVVDGQDRVYSFWLVWDDVRQHLALQPFGMVADAASIFADDAEYLAARRRLGLP
ncbi:MAG: hypothetical protein AB7P40_30860 [Chloroflexota bacterium]